MPYHGELVYEQRPVSLNASYNHHRKERTAHVIEWREAFYWLAKSERIPTMAMVAFTVQSRMFGQLMDPMNDVVSAKAAIDGLVQAKVIPDDTIKHVAWVKFLPPIRVPPKERQSMTLIIDEVVD